MTNPCIELHAALSRHQEVGDFESMSTWMTNRDTIFTAKEALIKIGATDTNPRVCLAMCMMACNSETTFDENRVEDQIMRREAMRFQTALMAILKEEEPDQDFKPAWKRAVRFYMAWTRQDKTHTMEQLMASVVARRARNVQSNEPEEPPEETFAHIRLLGGDVAEQEARRLYAGAWRPVGGQDLVSNVAEVAERAFWDAIADHTSNGRYDALFSVLGEIEESMKAMISYSSERQEDLKDKFDPSHLKLQAEHGALERDDIVRLIRFLAETIASWHASVDATDAAEWVASVHRTIDDAPNDLGAFLIVALIPFLKDVVHRLQRLYGRVLQASQEMEAARASSSASEQD